MGTSKNLCDPTLEVILGEQEGLETTYEYVSMMNTKDICGLK